MNNRVRSCTRKQFLFETPLGVWLRSDYFCMVSPVKRCCTPIHGLNDRSVEACHAFTFLPLPLWQTGVSQVHSVCLTFPYLSKNNKQLMFCCGTAFRQCRHSSNILYSVSVPTKQLSVCCGHPKADGSLCMGVGVAKINCVAAWASHQGRDACSWVSKGQKSSFGFFLGLFFFITSVWYRFRTQKLVHTDPPSFLSLLSKYRAGHMWKKTDFQIRMLMWLYTSGGVDVWWLSKQLWMKYGGLRLP